MRQEPALADQVVYGAVRPRRLARQRSPDPQHRAALGLDFPLTERFDRAGWLDFQSAVPGLTMNGAPVVGGLQFAYVDGNPRYIKNKDLNNFAPRLLTR
ncbi:MAG: hypothetical protein R2748_03150 [Bryobacterales bacterium]